MLRGFSGSDRTISSIQILPRVRSFLLFGAKFSTFRLSTFSLTANQTQALNHVGLIIINHDLLGDYLLRNKRVAIWAHHDAVDHVNAMQRPGGPLNL